MRSMKTLLTLLVVSRAAVALAGCSGAAKREGKVQVVAAFYPLAYAAEMIGDDRVEVSNLTPPGAEPHDLEVSPSDVRRIRSADLALLLGHGFQPQLEDAAGHGRHVLELLNTPGLHRYANDDPHVWLDPLRYAVIARRIGAVLHAPRRAARFAARLRALDAEFRRGLSK